MKRIIIIIILISVSTSLTYSYQPNIQFYEQLNDRIYGHLEYLSDKGKTNRMVSGGIMSGLGVLFAIGGIVLINQVEDKSNMSLDDEMSLMLGYASIGAGTISGGIGLLALLIPSREERAFSKYAEYPEGTENELINKIQRGERDFRDLADHRKQARILSGGFSIASGVSSLLFLRTYDAYGDYFGALSIGTGLASLLIKQPAEKEWEFYLERRDELRSYYY